MAYLGPPPSQKLATPTSRYFSGNGSATAFTLNRPVNVAEDLNVFVNNVAQQPGSGKSYTATGTTLHSMQRLMLGQTMYTLSTEVWQSQQHD